MPSNKIYIYGRRTMQEALENAPSLIERVFLAPQMDDAGLLGLIRKNKIPVEHFAEKQLPRDVDKEATHQGIIGVTVSDKLTVQYEDFIKNLKVGQRTCLVLLDELQDPQNIGAIIRSAAAFGAAGVLIPKNNQTQITGAVVKVSAGMAFRIPLVSIGNVNNTIRDLKERRFWIYGLETGSSQKISDEKFDAPAVLVFGNEGAGVREKTLELCDIKLEIPIDPRCESLNVAASAAVALYAWSARRK